MEVVAQEPTIRIGCFLGTLVLVGLWEGLAPRRQPGAGRRARWPGNLGIVALDALLLRAVLPVTAVGMAALAEARGWGFLGAIGGLPWWLAALLALVALDFAVYLQHVVFHAVPLLWRVHRVHHADPDFDLTTGVRFHPVEMLLSMGGKLLVIAALGAPAAAVLGFEVALSTSSLFNHGNLGLPDAIDRVLRWVIVTPDMHRVHHSVVGSETNTNFGFTFSWWDRLGGTYRAQPAAGHEGMTIGLEQFRGPEDLRLDRLLIQPFLGEGGTAALAPRPNWLPGTAEATGRASASGLNRS